MRRPFKLVILFSALWVYFPSSPGRLISPESPRAGGAAENEASGTYQSRSASGEQELRRIIESGRLEDLQWANFSVHSASVKDFYEQTGYKLAWTDNGKLTTQASQLIQTLENAEQKGLDSKDYDGARWTERVQKLQNESARTELAAIKFDVALTVSGIRYVSDLHLGRVDPESLHKDFDPERQGHDPGTFLITEVRGAQSVADALTAVECPYAGYKRDLLGLQKYLQMAKEERLEPLPRPQKPIAPGGVYEGLGKLVRRLQFLGDLPSTVTVSDSGTYTQNIADGVKRFQSRHGIEADGKLGPRTIAELEEPMSHRVQQLRLSLERWRWLPHNFAELPIVVNIPEFRLRAGDGSQAPKLTMAVVVGKAMRTQTPVLEEDMEYVVFWPYWNVPPSILRSELIPKVAKDRGYLQKNGYEVTAYSGEVVTDAAVNDEVLARLRAGKLTIRQKPGPKNALGLAKFIFPNDNNVYLHSTPAQALFSRSRRDFSHGCIRVEDPKALAVWVLRNNPGWTREKIELAFESGNQQQVNLTRAIPVLVVYATAVAEEDGQVLFLEDIYGHDKALSKLEAQAYASQGK